MISLLISDAIGIRDEIFLHSLKISRGAKKEELLKIVKNLSKSIRNSGFSRIKSATAITIEVEDHIFEVYKKTVKIENFVFTDCSREVNKFIREFNLHHFGSSGPNPENS